MAGSIADHADDSAAVIVLLAAGEGRRYGGIKQLADIHGEPMVHRAARIAMGTGARVIVVTGAYAEQVSAALADLPLLVTHHLAWAEGMGSSLAAGMRVVRERFPSASGALLCLADQPLLDTTSLEKMLGRHRQMPGRILATEHGGVAGPPVLFPGNCLDELGNWSGAHGAQALLHRESHRLELFASEVTIDVDTQGDLDRVRQQLA